jgi:hypothetical protein
MLATIPASRCSCAGGERPAEVQIADRQLTAAFATGRYFVGSSKLLTDIVVLKKTGHKPFGTSRGGWTSKVYAATEERPAATDPADRQQGEAAGTNGPHRIGHGNTGWAGA